MRRNPIRHAFVTALCDCRSLCSRWRQISAIATRFSSFRARPAHALAYFASRLMTSSSQSLPQHLCSPSPKQAFLRTNSLLRNSGR